MTLVVGILLLVVWQRSWAGVLFMRRAAHIRADGGFDFLREATIRLEVVAAPYHILALLAANNGQGEVYFVSADHAS